MILTETQYTEYLARANDLYGQMRLKPKGSKFEMKSRQVNSVAYIAAALAFKSLQMANAVDGQAVSMAKKITRTDMARLFCKSELSNSGSGKVVNWGCLIDEFQAQGPSSPDCDSGAQSRARDLAGQPELLAGAATRMGKGPAADLSQQGSAVDRRPAEGDQLLEGELVARLREGDDPHLEFGHDDVDDALEQLQMEDVMMTDDDIEQFDVSAVLDEALPAFLIDSLHQAFRLPKSVVRILARLLQDEYPTDDFALRRYFEEKLVMLVQQLRPSEPDPNANIGLLCHHECTEEMIAKGRAFERTLTAACPDDDTVIIGLSLNIERRIFEEHPKLASKLSAGLLLRILSAATAIEPNVLDGFDGLKRLLARVVRSTRSSPSPPASPTGGGCGGGNEDTGAGVGAVHAGESIPPQESRREDMGSTKDMAQPKAWVPPEQLGDATKQLGDPTKHEWIDGLHEQLGLHEWLDVGDDIDDKDVPPSLRTDALVHAPPDASPAAAPLDSSISSATAALVWGSGANSAGVSATTQHGSSPFATPTSSVLFDALNEDGRLPACASPLDASRLALNTADNTDCIGKGAFSVVLRGTLGKEPVAVKILNGYYFDQPMKVRFLKEAALLQFAARGCSRVCRFFGTVLVHEQPAIVMKLYPQSLRDVLHAAPSRRLHESLALEYAHQLACALVELHGLTPSILVLDLKPANLLLDGNGMLHVADFGVSKVLSETATLAATLDSVRGGTAYYMAPEQLSDGDPVGKPADVYGSAAVVYEMCAGEPPYATSANGTSLNMVQIVKKVCVDKAMPAALMAEADEPRFSTALAALLRRCLAFEPGARPSASEVRDGIIQVKMRAPAMIEALDERRRGYDTGARDAELQREALRCAGEVAEDVPASERPWMVDLAEHLSECLAAPRREAFATMRANIQSSAHLGCDPSVAAAISELEAAQTVKDQEVVARYQQRCDDANEALCQQLAAEASEQTAATVVAIESMSTDPYDEAHRLNQKLRSFDVSDPTGINSGSLEGEYYLSCYGPMLLPDDSAMVQLVALKAVLAEELARSRQALFEALQKRSKSGFAKLNIRQCPECKRGWSDAGGCQWRMCGSTYVSKNDMRLDDNQDLVFGISEMKFDDNGEVVRVRPTLQVERFFGVRRSEPFGTLHPKDNEATISERLSQTFNVEYNADLIHHGCGFVGWFSEWKPVDTDDL